MDHLTVYSQNYISVRTTIIKDDCQIAYSLDWQYGSVQGKNSLHIHAA